MDKYFFEIWKPVKFEDNISEKEVYEVSNYGRVKSFKIDTENGIILKPQVLGRYHVIYLKQKNGKKTVRLVHKLVAELFIPKDDEAKNLVFHRDYNPLNNRIENLEWVTRAELEKYKIKNPLRKTHKLTAETVRIIKKKIFSPNRKTRMKMIAKQFGISEMQLYRIKTGENWAHVKID